MNNIFVKNLSFKSTHEDVRKLFEAFGTVTNVMLKEKKKGKSRGFGFLEMPNEQEKNKAIAALNGKEFMERVLVVVPALPKAKFFSPRERRQDKREDKREGKREDRPAEKKTELKGFRTWKPKKTSGGAKFPSKAAKPWLKKAH